MKSIRNYLQASLNDQTHCHGGVGTLKHHELFSDSDFTTNIKFIKYMILPPKTSIGNHKHGDNEELYIILEGSGRMTVDEKVSNVGSGDVILNKPFGLHGLENNSNLDMKILVIEVYS